MKAKLIKTERQYVLSANDADLNKFESAIDTDSYGWVIADEYGGYILKLSKQNCDEIFGVVDVEKLFLEVPHTVRNEEDYWKIRAGFIEGFNKAMELNKDKVFTLEDMGNLWDFCTYNKGTFAEFIQSLRESTEIEVEIKMEPCFYDQSLGGFSTSYTEDKPKEQPKLDEDGCLILKKI